MADFGGADAERQRAECAMGAGVAVPADDGFARLGQAHFRPDDMHDAAPRIAQAEQLDAMFLRVGDQPLHLLFRLRGGIGQLSIRTGFQRRRAVIERGLGQVRAAHGKAALFQHRKGLRAGDFMDQVQIDIQDSGRVGGFRHHDVALP